MSWCTINTSLQALLKLHEWVCVLLILLCRHCSNSTSELVYYLYFFAGTAQTPHVSLCTMDTSLQVLLKHVPQVDTSLQVLLKHHKWVCVLRILLCRYCSNTYYKWILLCRYCWNTTSEFVYYGYFFAGTAQPPPVSWCTINISLRALLKYHQWVGVKLILLCRYCSNTYHKWILLCRYCSSTTSEFV